MLIPVSIAMPERRQIIVLNPTFYKSPNVPTEYIGGLERGAVIRFTWDESSNQGS